MRSWVITELDTLKLVENIDYSIPKDSCMIKMVKAGISPIDVKLFNGILPRAGNTTPGRTGVGILTEVGENNYGLVRGQRVVIEPHFAIPGENGRFQTLGNGSVGTLSDFVIAPASNVYPVPSHIADNDLLFTEQVAIATRVINSIKIEKGEFVAINGANSFGMIMSKLILNSQAVPILIDTDDNLLARAEQFGIYYRLNSQTHDIKSSLKSITGGLLCQKAILASAENLSWLSEGYIAPKGQIVAVGWTHVKYEYMIDASIILENELKVIGINNAHSMMPQAINALATKAVTPSVLIRDMIPFSEADKFFNSFIGKLPVFFQTACAID